MVGLSNRQKIDIHRGPPGNYNQLKKPLTEPPRGKYWKQDEDTREWILEDVEHIYVIGDDEDVIVDATTVEVVPLDGSDIVASGNDESDENTNTNTDRNTHNADSIVDGSNVAVDETIPYLEHIIQEHDTLEGLCLRYKVTATEIRQANGGFSGSNLLLAPNPLRIVNMKHFEASLEFQLKQLAKACPTLAETEAKAYLDLNDGDLKEAIANAKEDGF